MTTKWIKHLETKLIHSDEPEQRISGAVAMPVFQSSTFEYTGESSYHDLKYIRLNNTPNHEVLHAKLAALENSEAALVTASGMAAISTTLLTVLGVGDHLLAHDCLYGGTQMYSPSNHSGCSSPARSHFASRSSSLAMTGSVAAAASWRSRPTSRTATSRTTPSPPTSSTASRA